MAMDVPWPCCVIRHIFNRRFLVIFVLIFLLFLPNGRLEKLPTDQSLSPSLLQKLEPECSQVHPRIFSDKTPKGKLGSEVKLTKILSSAKIEDCVEACCGQPNCQIVFMYKNLTEYTCYKGECAKVENCLPGEPEPKKLEQIRGKVFMVLVRPSDSKYSSWVGVDPSLANDLILSSPATSTTASTASPLSASTTAAALRSVTVENGDKVCEVGLDLQDCKANEECVPVQDKSRNGLCQCKEGFIRNPVNRECVSDVTTPVPSPTPPPPPQKIVVSVHSKEIQLPESTAKLTAYAIPEPTAQSTYNYEWKLMSGPAKGEMENSHGQILSLKSLEEGTYQFKIIVSGGNPPVAGEGFGNVTVLPAQRVNKPPKAIVQPATQTVTLPTTKAIIDGSGSSDDADGLKFKWEILNGPVNYQHELPTEPTLTLVDLVAGNYTIQLTVTDSDGASDTTRAQLTVNEEIDYKPTANAGEDIILYLPNNEVDLHGNMSSDDHGIVGWEWTRANSPSGGRELAADTNNMRTPHPHLSNLEEGVYTFSLKVTDIKGQFDEDQVNVYVKAPISLPPTADAGRSQEFSLPKNWALLDGSASKDDVSIASFNWTQVSGPNQAVLEFFNSSMCNATGLTKGKYVFKLVVKDDLGNIGESSVEVTVNQDSNNAPVANAGQDFQVILPQSVVVINGSSSYDDLKIVKYLWTRLPSSLAAGKILGTSSTEAALLLVNLVPGNYDFQLQVWDEQGKSSTDKVSVKVRDNPEHANVIQALLNVKLTDLTQSRLDAFTQSFSLLLRNDGSASFKVLNLSPQKDTGFVIVHFIMETTLLNGSRSIVPGMEAVNELETKLKASQDILDLKVLELDTLECQNPCSGHGKCQQATRMCICDHFWIENPLRRHLMDGKSNCDWSVIYVGIFSAIIVAAIICLVAFLICKRKRRLLISGGSSNGRPRKRYSRLEQSELEMRHTHTSSLMTSESESEDEEFNFDDDLNPRTKLAGTNGGPAGIGAKKNGYAKLNRETNA